MRTMLSAAAGLVVGALIFAGIAHAESDGGVSCDDATGTLLDICNEVNRQADRDDVHYRWLMTLDDWLMNVESHHHPEFDALRAEIADLRAATDRGMAALAAYMQAHGQRVSENIAKIRALEAG